MSLWSTIEEVRKKPKAVRTMYAFWVAFGMTSCIAVIWVTSLPARVDFLSVLIAPEEDAEVSTTEVDASVRALRPTVDEDREVSESSWVVMLSASVVTGWNGLADRWYRATKDEGQPKAPGPSESEPVWQPQVATSVEAIDAPVVLLATSSHATATTPTTTENMLQ